MIRLLTVLTLIAGIGLIVFGVVAMPGDTPGWLRAYLAGLTLSAAAFCWMWGDR